MTHPQTERLTAATDRFKYWWDQNKDDRLNIQDYEVAQTTRLGAEGMLFEAHERLDPGHKIQLVAGAKAIQLFQFSKTPYGFLEIDEVPEDMNLQPYEVMDLMYMRKGLRNRNNHGSVAALYAGTILHTHSLAIAEALTNEGAMRIVPADTEETYQLGAHPHGTH